MTVGDLIKLLCRFPPHFPVFISLEDAERRAMVPQDAVMNLVHQPTCTIIGDDGESRDIPDGFVDSVVIYPYVVHPDW